MPNAVDGVAPVALPYRWRGLSFPFSHGCMTRVSYTFPRLLMSPCVHLSAASVSMRWSCFRSSVVLLADKCCFPASFLSFIWRLFFQLSARLMSPRAILLESVRQTTRVRPSNDSSPFGVGTRVLERKDSTRTASVRCKSVNISYLKRKDGASEKALLSTLFVEFCQHGSRFLQVFGRVYAHRLEVCGGHAYPVAVL